MTEERFEELMELNNKVALKIFGITYKNCSPRGQEVVNGFVQNYLLLTRMKDAGVELEHDSSIWDKCGGVESRDMYGHVTQISSEEMTRRMNNGE